MNDAEALKERNKADISHFQCSIQLFQLTRGDALRSAQRLPLATIFRAFGACPLATISRLPALRDRF